MSSSSFEEFSIRASTLADAETIIRHRRSMFLDMGYRDVVWLDAMSAAFLPWLRRKMEAGEYLGWLAVALDRSIAAGAGLWLQDWMPAGVTADSRRGYILNVYTEPQYRRRGLARRLMQLMLDHCRARGLAMAALNASDEGRPLYQSLGFKPTNDMRLDLR